MASSYTLYIKTLNVKASYATSALARAAAVMKTIDTKVISGGLLECTVYLNCTGVGVANLDVDVQITPDTTVGSEVWYTTQQFAQITTSESQQAQKLAAIGRKIRCYPTLTGTHNFGLQLSYPLSGYTS